MVLTQPRASWGPVPIPMHRLWSILHVNPRDTTGDLLLSLVLSKDPKSTMQRKICGPGRGNYLILGHPFTVHYYGILGAQCPRFKTSDFCFFVCGEPQNFAQFCLLLRHNLQGGCLVLMRYGVATKDATVIWSSY